jgi:DnaD/phage-associated family protein
MADLPWFRFYSETVNDVKFKRVSREIGADTLTVIGAWAVILCLASRSPQRGKLYLTDNEPYSIDDLSDALHWSGEDTAALIDEFIIMGMVRLVDGAFEISNWDKRQYESDSARNRMRTYRERLRNSNVTVTPPDTDTDTESDIDNNSAAAIEKQSNIFILYEQNIGPITPLMADKLKHAEKDYPADWIQDAFQAAVNADARNWNYIYKVLENRRLGKDKPRPSGNGSKPTDNKSHDEAVIAELVAERRSQNESLRREY